MIELTDRIKNDLSSFVTSAEYLISIERQTPLPKLYIGTRQQMFDDDELGVNAVFYEDLNLKISGIREKIDLRTRKINLSNVNISFNNFKNSSGRLSDRIGNGIGQIISVYLKTQSCQDITDCALIAKLKISRIVHDSDKITINANDISLDSFFIDLPGHESVLTPGRTFAAYENKPVPILFGHLSKAPAIPYMNTVDTTDLYSDNGIEILFDNSAITSGDAQVHGVKNFTIPGVYDESEYLECHLIIDRTLMIGVSSEYYYVNCLPYINTNKVIAEDYHNYPQYQTKGDRISMISKYGDYETILFNSALWVHSFSGVKSRQSMTLFLHGQEANADRPLYVVYDDGGRDVFKDLSTRKNIGTLPADIPGLTPDKDVLRLSIGVQKVNFEPLSGYNTYKEEDSDGNLTPYPVDLSITGNIALSMIYKGGESSPELSTHKVYAYPSGFKIDEDAQGDITTPMEDYVDVAQAMGFPSELVTTNPAYSNIFDFMSSNWIPNSIKEKFEVSAVYEFTFKGLTHENDSDNAAYSYKSYFDYQYLASTGGGAGMGKPFRAEFQGGSQDQWNWQGLNCNAISFYHYPDTNSLGDQDNDYIFYDALVGISGLGLRRAWAEADVFSNEFFVDAKGRVGGEYENVSTIQGVITVLHPGDPDNPLELLKDVAEEGGESNPVAGYNRENRHAKGLYSILHGGLDKTKNINGHIYQVMLYDEMSDCYIYDIEIENMHWRSPSVNDGAVEYNSAVTRSYLIPADETPEPIGDSYVFVQNLEGWDFYIKAKKVHFSDSGLFYSTGVAEENFYPTYYMQGFKLVYGRIIYGENPNEISEILREEHSTLNDYFNNPNGYWVDPTDTDDTTFTGYGLSFVRWREENETPNAPILIEKPAQIIRNLMQTEMNVSDDMIDEDKYLNALNEGRNTSMAFSINEVKNSKDIIEDICRQSRLFFRYRARDGKAEIGTIKNQYNTNLKSQGGDVDKKIKSENVIKFSFTKTKMEDLCIGGCLVNYRYNYLTNKNERRTSLITLDATNPESGDSIRTRYRNYYGVIPGDEDNYLLEIDAPYIQSDSVATELRDFMFEFYKHQHLLLKLTLPFLEAADLEVGDIISFDDNINDTNCYGRSLVHGYTNINQYIYPIYMITSCSKNLKEVTIEAIQLHELNLTSSDFTPTIAGCTDPLANNYNADATVDDGSRDYDPPVPGCMNAAATNYNPEATYDDGSCVFPEGYFGCTDPAAENYNPDSVLDDGSCEYAAPPTRPVVDMTVENYVTMGLWGINVEDAKRYTFFPGDTVIIRSDATTDNVDGGTIESWWDFHMLGADTIVDGFASFQENSDVNFSLETWYEDGYGEIKQISFTATEEMLGKTFGHAARCEDNDGLVSPEDTSHLTVISIIDPFIPGDVDLNGDVNVQDIIKIVQHVLGNLLITVENGFDEQSVINADFNQDGLIDILDVVGMVTLVLEG